MRQAILVLSLLGTLLFGAGLLASWLDPLIVERAARELVRIEIEHQVGAKIDVLSNSRIVGLAQKVLRKTDEEVEATKDALREEVPRKVANVIADMLDKDCECRKRLAGYLQRSEEQRLASLTALREGIAVLVESSYASVTRNLMREFRIFCGSNALAFTLLGIVTVFRRRATLQLLLPTVVVVGAVSITAGLYLFNQNWLHTIVFGQYVGFAYPLYLAGVALLLVDIAFNRARVTTQLVNLMLQAVGSAVTAVPC